MNCEQLAKIINIQGVEAAFQFFTHLTSQIMELGCSCYMRCRA